MLQLGQRLGDFEIIRLLGRGGMGEVYEAQQLNPSRRVALKVLAPWLADSEDALERFRREAEVPARLDHPNIVRIIATGKTPDGLAFFTMQLVQGISLADLLRQANDSSEPSTAAEPTREAGVPIRETPTGAQLEPPRCQPPSRELLHDIIREFQVDRFRFVARYGAQAARALAYAHSQNVLHRDIKPSNLMIDHHRQLYIVDFGLTRCFGPSAMASQVGPVRGTPWYMSPEQARGEEVDHRSDIYSLGVSLYELATRGVGPFTANRESSEAVLAQVRAGQGLPLRLVAPQMPKPLEAVITKAMQFRPQKRYQSAAEMADALQAAAGTQPGVNLHASVRLRSRPLAVVAAAIAVLGGLLAVAVLLATYGFSLPDREPSTAPAQGQNAATATVEDERLAYPEHIRPRAIGIPMPLLMSHAEPAYRKRLYGEGKYSTVGTALALQSTSGGNPTVLAVAHDPENQNFEFSCELGTGSSEAAAASLGIFIGWKQNLPERPERHRCLWLKLNARPTETFPNGAFIVGTTLVVPRDAHRGAELQWGTSLLRGRGLLPLARKGDWHHIGVRVAGRQVRVRIDEQSPADLDMQALLAEQRGLLGDYQPTGYHGIWVAEGVGLFRNITLEALPSGAP